jgi:hypothetical protein
MTPPDPGALVATAFSAFQGYLTTNAPALLGIGIVAFAIPFVFKWAKHLVS